MDSFEDEDDEEDSLFGDGKRLSLGPQASAAQPMRVEETARSVAKVITASYGKIPFEATEAALEHLLKQAPALDKTHFLRYVNALQYQMYDDAEEALRMFQDAQHTRPGLDPVRSTYPESLQHSILAMAGIFCDMGCLDSALSAISDAVMAAQESADGARLCFCLHWLSRVLDQAGKSSQAYTVLHRSMARAEAAQQQGLQALCALGVARMLTMNPILGRQPLSAPGPSRDGSRPVGQLPSLLGVPLHDRLPRDHDVSACRQALSHCTIASSLSVATGEDPGKLRPKVLLSTGEVARQFGLRSVAQACTKVVVDAYRHSLEPEDLSAAVRCLGRNGTKAENVSALMGGLAGELPEAPRLWRIDEMDAVLKQWLRQGEYAKCRRALHKRASMMRSVSQEEAQQSKADFIEIVNAVRVAEQRHDVAYKALSRAAQEASQHSPHNSARHRLSMVDILLEVEDYGGALTQCLMAKKVADQLQFTHLSARVSIRMAEIHFGLGDLVPALRIAEETVPEVLASEEREDIGKVHLVLGEILLALASDCPSGKAATKVDESDRLDFIRAAREALETGTAAYDEVGAVRGSQDGHYLLARICHELGDPTGRDRHAELFRSATQGTRQAPPSAPAVAEVSDAVLLGQDVTKEQVQQWLSTGCDDLLPLRELIQASGHDEEPTSLLL
mmetsp:Transcript_84796/g.226668  ORF Transcript_84796/g.226668 Transcript_84796/m.226668 type:complete len:676 (+) Transcript_84796:55-2082(+)